jgi:hypothetical protein
MRLSYGRLAAAAVAILGTLVVLGAGVDALTLALKVPVDPREGWNAYNAEVAISGGRLYPGGLWFNNYPPLSYFAVGRLGAIVGDAIVAGRIVALTSALMASWLVGLAASRMHCGRFESVLAGLLFAASPWVLSKYAQMNDPQMLGQALGCAGFAVVVWQPGRIAFIALGAFLLALALFVKPMFVVQPLALLVWFALYDRKSAALFMIFGIAFCLAALLLTDTVLRTDLLGDMLLARVYTPSRIFSHPGQWLVTGLAPLGATVCLLRYRRDRYAMLCAIYALVAIPLCLYFSGGEGVAGNATFDLSIACALGAAVFVSRLKDGNDAHSPHPVIPGERERASVRAREGNPVGQFSAELDVTRGRISGDWAAADPGSPSFARERTARALAWDDCVGSPQESSLASSFIVSASVLPLAIVFVIGMFGGWASGPSILERMKLAPVAQRDIAFIEAHAGPALCEQPALCYWAGKPAQIDVWGLSQALAEHTRPESSLATLLDAQRFGVIVVNARSALSGFARIRSSLARNYAKNHADPLGIFLVPVIGDRT